MCTHHWGASGESLDWVGGRQSCSLQIEEMIMLIASGRRDDMMVFKPAYLRSYRWLFISLLRSSGRRLCCDANKSCQSLPGLLDKKALPA